MVSKNGRSCRECTKCCEGYLSGNAKGHDFYAGRPCHFVQIGKGCAIYSERPVDPCVSYQCAWKRSPDIPEWMKPSEVDAILDERTSPGGIPYLNLVEAGKLLDVRVLSWVFQFALREGKNLLWSLDGGKQWIGSPEFVAEMSGVAPVGSG